MKKLKMLVMACVTLFIFKPVFCLTLMGTVNHINFYKLEAAGDMRELQGLQQQLEHCIQKEKKDLQVYYNNFKKGNAILVVGLDQKLKLMACCFINNASLTPIIHILPRAKSIIDASCLKNDLLMME